MKNTLTIIFIMSMIMVSAQDIAGVKKHMFKANLLLAPSLEYEMGISKNSSIGIRVGTELGGVENSVNDEVEFALFPSLSAYYRYYYNFNRRVKKGKNVLNNSANYVGLVTSFFHTDPIIGNADPEDDYFMYVGPVWGFQRTYWKRLNLALDLGIGYSFSNLDDGISPIGNFTMGWVFGK